MIDALVSGTLIATPVEKVSAKGNAYVSAKLRVPVAEGEALFVAVSAFGSDVRRALAALGQGDPVTAVGPLKVGTWTPPDGGEARPNVSLIANAVLTPYAVARRREAMHGDKGKDKGNGNGTANLGKLDRMHGGERRARQAQRPTAPAMADDPLDF